MLNQRPTRLRKTPAVRAMLKETWLHPSQWIAPLFVSALCTEPVEIASMPGQMQLPVSALPGEVAELKALGIQAVLLFGLPAFKDLTGSACLEPEGIIQQAVRVIKAAHPEMLVITDICLCEYTSHGHCGILENTEIDTERTLHQLAQQAVSHAEAGADWVAPSSMTDGMVGAIRKALDAKGFTQTAILSYSVKYASCLYGPFRQAAQGAPQFGNRKAYQMDPANGLEALREVALDVAEGADLLMVKPALFYLDIITQVKQHYPHIPLCAYQVSGEYAMIKQAARMGIFNEEQAMIESVTAIARAGADLIISYFAKDLARWYIRTHTPTAQ